MGLFDKKERIVYRDRVEYIEIEREKDLLGIDVLGFHIPILKKEKRR